MSTYLNDRLRKHVNALPVIDSYFLSSPPVPENKEKSVKMHTITPKTKKI